MSAASARCEKSGARRAGREWRRKDA